MKKVVFSWFILANLFCFVTTFAELRLPWMPETSSVGNHEQVSDVGYLTQSALGGAAGSYLGLLLNDRLSSPADGYLSMSMYLLMAQNAASYILVLALVWSLRFRRTVGRVVESERNTDTGPELSTGAYREASA